MVKTYYLAHNWENRHAVRAIQKYIEKHYNVRFINPFYDIEQAEDMIQADFNDVIEKYYGSGEAVKSYMVDISFSLDKKIRYRNEDLKAIDNSDGLVCILLETSRAIGSIKEIFYAHEITKKDVYLICSDKRFTKHMWHDIEVNKTFETIMAYLSYLEKNGLMRK